MSQTRVLSMKKNAFINIKLYFLLYIRRIDLKCNRRVPVNKFPSDSPTFCGLQTECITRILTLAVHISLSPFLRSIHYTIIRVRSVRSL